MRRLMPMLAALALVLTAAACGGGSEASGPYGSGMTLTPARSVKQAATKTSQAPSEHMALDGSITVNGQVVTVTADGDFDNAKRVGAVTLSFNAGGLTGTIDEVIDGTTIYLRSPLFTDLLPSGKTWVKIDLQQAGSSKGIDFSALGSQDPMRMLDQLRAVGTVKEVGDEQVDGVDTTHYRGRIDPAKLPAGAKVKILKGARFGAYDVWIGKDDGYVRRVRFAFSIGKGNAAQYVKLTTTFSDFGKAVSVTVPPASETVDGTHASIGGLGS